MAFPGSRSLPGSSPTSPLQEGPSRQGFGGTRTYTATTRLWPRDANAAQANGFPVDDLHGLLGTLLHGLGTMQPNNPSNSPNAPPNPFSIIASMLNPANAAHGDAVYSQEALDRIISQLMEQQNGSTAPGPASSAAIASLPKKPVDKSMLGSDGKAECSVCMDNVEVGDQVTVLPCSHWFHGDCVGAWLKEHDTCPHCRQGIMPRESDSASDQPGSPGQPPRNGIQIPPNVEGSGSRRNPFILSDSSPSSPTGTRPGSVSSDQRPEGSDRRRASTRDSGGGGIAGWIGRRFGSNGGT
ncbi:hypothetical protein MMC20_001635 [Loxospora ochrophaea]|nr:hypothetical protein [Loxospora ochrophaea]